MVKYKCNISLFIFPKKEKNKSVLNSYKAEVKCQILVYFNVFDTKTSSIFNIPSMNNWNNEHAIDY